MILNQYFICVANDKTSVLFLYGVNPEIGIHITKELNKEQDTFGDIIQVDGLVDTYNNLTLKALYTLRFFLKTGKYRG